MKPKVIVFVGSTRFKTAWEKAAIKETLAGNITLTPALYPHADNIMLNYEQKEALDQLQLRKIDLADEVLVINVNGYVGDSTQKQILYAMKQNIPIRYLFPEKGNGHGA